MLPPAESLQFLPLWISILFLLLSFRKSVYGAISYFIILNAKIGEMYPILGKFRFELLAAVLVLSVILIKGRTVKQCFPSATPLNKLLWALFIVGMASVPQAVDVRESWDLGGYNLLKMTLFYIMIVCSVEDARDIWKIVWAFALVSLWIAYEPIANYINGTTPEYGYGVVAVGRFGAAAGHVALANTLCQAIPLVYYSAFSIRRKLPSLLMWGILGILTLGVILTKSRGGFIGLVSAYVSFIMLSRKKLKVAIILLGFFMASLPLAGPDYLNHIKTIKYGIHGSRSSSDRYLGLVNGISMMLKRPVLGVGIGCYARARKIYFNYYFYAHNLYGELMGELGLASIVWFYWIYSVFRRATWLKNLSHSKQENDFVHILTGIQVALFVRLVLGNFSHSAFIWFWFLMAAVVASIENISRADTLQMKNHEIKIERGKYFHVFL